LSQEIANMRATLQQISLQTQNPDIGNLFVSNHNIAGYFCYVDDILIIYDESTTNTKELLHCFNNPNPKLKFTLEKVLEHRINFLDLTIHRQHNTFSIDIYRKPTFTDTIIPNDPCHPEEHKLAAVRSLYDRLDNYHLPPDRRQNEDNRIQQILQNKGYITPTRPPTCNYNTNPPRRSQTKGTAHQPAHAHATTTNTNPPRKSQCGPDSPTAAEKQEP